MRQISRVIHLNGRAIEGEVDLGGRHWVFPQHFPGDPIYPGSLLIEAGGQLVALWAWAQGQRGRPRLLRANAQFHEPAGPGHDHLLVRAEVRRKQQMNFAAVEVWAAECRVATMDAVLTVLPAG